MDLQLDKVKQQAKEREQEIQKEQNKKIQEVMARYEYWRKAYYVKDEECKIVKRELDLGRALCRFFLERSLQRASDSSSRLALNMVHGGYIGCSTPLEQLPVMNLFRSISMLTCTEACKKNDHSEMAVT